MKTMLFSLAVTALGTPHVVNAAFPPTDGFCSSASVTAKTVINLILLAFGLAPIC